MQAAFEWPQTRRVSPRREATTRDRAGMLCQQHPRHRACSDGLQASSRHANITAIASRVKGASVGQCAAFRCKQRALQYTYHFARRSVERQGRGGRFAYSRRCENVCRYRSQHFALRVRIIAVVEHMGLYGQLPSSAPASAATPCCALQAQQHLQISIDTRFFADRRAKQLLPSVDTDLWRRHSSSCPARSTADTGV